MVYGLNCRYDEFSSAWYDNPIKIIAFFVVWLDH